MENHDDDVKSSSYAREDVKSFSYEEEALEDVKNLFRNEKKTLEGRGKKISGENFGEGRCKKIISV